METANRQKILSKLEPVPNLKKPSTTARKRSISAANVFKHRAPSKGQHTATKTAVAASRGDNHGAATHKGNKQAKLDSESPLKATSEQSDSAKHPLAAAFNGKLIVRLHHSRHC